MFYQAEALGYSIRRILKLALMSQPTDELRDTAR